MINYEMAIIKLIPLIREQISKSPDNIIRIKVADIKKEMGPEFAKISEIELYWGLKSILYKYSIDLETGMTINNEALFLMRSSKEKKISMPTKKLTNVEIPIVGPEEIPSPEKRFFQEMIEHIDSIELSSNIKLSYEQKLKLFGATVEGAKSILTSFHQFEKDLEWYHADVKVSFVLGFRDALDQFKDILSYFSTYTTEENIEEDIGAYFDMFIIGENFIQNIIESGGRLPEIINIVKAMEIIKSGEYQTGTFNVQIKDPERIWIAIIYYINNMK